MFEAIVIGNVGSVKLFTGSTPVLNVSVAASRRVGEREYTDWVSVKIWGERAGKLAAHIHKGMRLLVRGRPEPKGFLRQDGTPAGELILHANELEFLSPKSQGEHHADAEHTPADESELPLTTYDTPSAAAEAAEEIKTRKQRRA